MLPWSNFPLSYGKTKLEGGWNLRRITLGLVGLVVALVLGMGGLAGTGTASADHGYYPTVTSTGCYDGSATMTISWNTMGAGHQYADYTYGGSFVSGSYYGMGPMPHWETTVTITGLTPGSTVSIRINTTTASGWTSTKVITVTAPACNMVYVAPPPRVVYPVIVPIRPIVVVPIAPFPPPPMPYPPVPPYIPPYLPAPPLPPFPYPPYPYPY